MAISGHLLAYDLSRISDALSIKMGSLYLRRLLILHTSRADALKNIVLAPPSSHPPTLICADREVSQARLTRAWAFAAAQLAWAHLPSEFLPSPPSPGLGLCLAGAGLTMIYGG